MAAPTRRTAGTQRGPRSASVVASVHEATRAELARVGFAGLTMDGVARAAGVHRSTLYRRWPSRAALLTDLLEPLLQAYGRLERTGVLEDDLFSLMSTIRDNTLRPEGRALFAALGQQAEELAPAVEQMAARTVQAFRSLLTPIDMATVDMTTIDTPADQTAADRPETLALSPDRELAAHLMFSSVVMWELTHGAPPSDKDLRRVIRASLPRP